MGSPIPTPPHKGEGLYHRVLRFFPLPLVGRGGVGRIRAFTWMSQPLTDEQIERYARHIMLPEVGGAGQARLLASKVLLVGAGGLGSPLALYLAAAGVGTLGIVDDDVVSLSNLQRQIAHKTRDIGRPKTDSAAESVADINPDVKVVRHAVRLDIANVRELIKRL